MLLYHQLSYFLLLLPFSTYLLALLGFPLYTSKPYLGHFRHVCFLFLTPFTHILTFSYIHTSLIHPSLLCSSLPMIHLCTCSTCLPFSLPCLLDLPSPQPLQASYFPLGLGAPGLLYILSHQLSYPYPRSLLSCLYLLSPSLSLPSSLCYSVLTYLPLIKELREQVKDF